MRYAAGGKGWAEVIPNIKGRGETGNWAERWGQKSLYRWKHLDIKETRGEIKTQKGENAVKKKET